MDSFVVLPHQGHVANAFAPGKIVHIIEPFAIRCWADTALNEVMPRRVIVFLGRLRYIFDVVRPQTGGRGRILGRVATALTCAAAIGCIAVGTAVASKAFAEGSPVNTFRVSGAGSGTLHPGPYAGCNNINVKSDGFTNLNDFVGSISGFTTNVASWSLDVIEKKTGTFKITGSFVNEPMVSVFPNPKNFHLAFPQGIKWRFSAMSGTVTVRTESGSISASLSDRAGQTLKITGSWMCKSKSLP